MSERYVQEFYVDSQDLTADGMVNLPKSVHATSFRVLSAQIPVSWYNVPTGTSFMWLENGVTERVGEVTLGNYTATSLAAHLDGLMKAYDAAYSVTFSPATLRFSFTGPVDFSLVLSGASAALAPLLGFPAATTTSNTFHESPYVCEMGRNYVYLVSDIIHPKRNSAPHSTNPLDPRSILCRIPVDAEFGEVITHCCEHSTVMQECSAGTNQVRLRLVGRSGASIDLNGAPWSATIQLLGGCAP